MPSEMWWTEGVAGAVKACQERNSVLVVLVEPSSTVTESQLNSSETSEQLLSRVATKTMHRVTFSDPALLQLVSDSQAVCLKFPCEESNEDYNAFKVYFKLSGDAPNLYFISPLTGQTLVQENGFVSAKTFLRSLVKTTRMVSGREVAVQRAPEESKTSQSWKEQMQELLAQSKPEKKGSTLHGTGSKIETVTQSPPSVSKARTEEPETAHRSLPASGMKLTKADETEGDQSRLLVRLPDGSQVRKSFPGSTKFSTVRVWLSEETRTAPGSLLITTAFPRRVFDLGEDPKMLSELGLVPSETLIVSTWSGGGSDGADSQQVAQSSWSGLRGYATGAIGVLGGFLRSFVADNPNVNSDNQRQGTASDSEPHGTRTQRGAPRAMRLQRTEVDDDENLLSNGNSTQYGWNPRDTEDDERRL